jgi:ribosomal protein S18 acetylase RimI-like enzyme
MSLKLLENIDYPRVLNIFESIFPFKYSEEFEDAWNMRNRGLSYGIEDANKNILGFVITKQIGENHQQIEFLGVNPNYQQGGIGTQLLKKVLQSNQRVTLIPVNDQRIIHWYKKHGFQKYGEPFVSQYTGDAEQLYEFVLV